MKSAVLISAALLLLLQCNLSSAISANSFAMFFNFQNDGIYITEEGTDIPCIIDQHADTVEFPGSPAPENFRGVAYDDVNRIVYIVSREDGAIYTLDKENDVGAKFLDVRSPWGVAVNTDTEYVYFTSTRPADRGIHYIRTNGADQGIIPGSDFGPTQGKTIAVGPVTGHVYIGWQGQIWRYSHDGSVAENIIAENDNIAIPVGMVINENEDTMYYTDIDLAKIEAVNLTAPFEREVLFQGGEDSSPRGLAEYKGYLYFFDPDYQRIAINGLDSIPEHISLTTDEGAFMINLFDYFIYDPAPHMPTVGCVEDIHVSTDPGAPNATVIWPSPVGSDAEGNITIDVAYPSPDVFPIGTTPVKVDATDSDSNRVTTQFDVVVTDNEAPVILGLPENITVYIDIGDPHAVVNWTEPIASDNSGEEVNVTQIDGLASGSMFELGEHNVTYYAEDPYGNNVTVTVPIFVVLTDCELPVLHGLPENITIYIDPRDPLPVVNWTEPMATDNSGGNVTVVQTEGPPPGSVFPVGETNVTYVATDPFGNSVSYTFTVYILITDVLPPRIFGVPHNHYFWLDFNTTAGPVFWHPANATDDNPGVNLTSNYEPGYVLPVGDHVIHYTAVDRAGNTVHRQFVISVRALPFEGASGGVTVVGQVTFRNKWLDEYNDLDSEEAHELAEHFLHAIDHTMHKKFRDAYAGSHVVRFTVGEHNRLMTVDFYVMYHHAPVAIVPSVRGTRHRVHFTLKDMFRDEEFPMKVLVSSLQTVIGPGLFEGIHPHRFDSEVKRSWKGGFIGRIDVEAPNGTHGWSMVMNFRRKVYDIGILDCEAEVAWTSRDRRIFVLVNTEESAVLNPNRPFRVEFTAETYKKLQGLEAIVDFWPQRVEGVHHGPPGPPGPRPPPSPVDE